MPLHSFASGPGWRDTAVLLLLGLSTLARPAELFGADVGHFALAANAGQDMWTLSSLQEWAAPLLTGDAADPRFVDCRHVGVVDGDEDGEGDGDELESLSSTLESLSSTCEL